MWLPDTPQDHDDRVAEIERDWHRNGMLLGEYVAEALTNATENGYDVAKWSVPVIAMDLSECDAGCQGLGVNDLRPHIEAWLSKQKT